MPHGYRQSNARLVWLMCPYLSAIYVADRPPNMAQVSVYKDERPGKRQSPWSISNQAFFRLPKKSQKISTHLLTVLINKCYSTTRTKEEEQKGTQKSSDASESGSPETNIRDYIEGADKAA